VVLDGADTYMANLGTVQNGLVTLTNTTLSECLRFAYGITTEDLVAGPEWIKNKGVRFDITGKYAPGTTRGQALEMLQNLLDQRFKLALKREPREFTYLALSAGAGSNLLKVAEEPAIQTQTGQRIGHIQHPHMSMGLLASLISRFTRMPVLDRTGIEGYFDIDLVWARDPTLLDPNSTADPVEGPSIYEAVRKQLGLKLEKRKGPVEVLVVEHAEKAPLPN
jgi:uncharacterized protein (TIGR03435 family)